MTRFGALIAGGSFLLATWLTGCGATTGTKRGTSTPGAPPVDRLISALKSPKADIRREAADALGASRDPRAVQPLIESLRDGEDRVRQAAADSLGKMGDLALEPLLSLLGDPQVRVRQLAAKALGDIRDPRAVEPLITTLGDADLGVRRQAAFALGPLKDSRAVRPLAGAAAKDPILYVTEKDPATAALVAMGAPAVDELIAALKDEDVAVRRGSAHALGKIADPRAVEPLIASTGDADPRVRGLAATALGRIRDSRAVAPLIALLEGADSGARRSAAEALAMIGGPSVDPLIGALRHRDPSVRKDAAWALGSIKDLRAITPLIATLKDADADVQRTASDAVAAFGELAVDPLIEDLRSPRPSDRASVIAAYYAGRALGMIGGPAVEPMTRLLNDPRPFVRHVAARELGTTKDPRAVDALVATVADAEQSVRLEATRALESIGSAARSSTEKVVRERTLIRAVDGLLIGLQDPDSVVRASAANALGELGNTRAVRPLLQAIRDGEPAVRWKAAWALENISDPAGTEEQRLARRAVDEFLAGVDLRVVAKDYKRIIAEGKKETVGLLILALERYGTAGMAEDLLNCGNEELEVAARSWAKRRAYETTWKPGFRGGPQWGFK